MLVVEDDAEVRGLFEYALGTAYELTQVADAESAWLLLDGESRFDAVVTDFALPGLSGLGLLARVRTSSRLSDMPIVIVSGHGEPLRRGALRAGADGYLAKPFAVRELRTALSIAIEQRARAV
ncbi:MAG: response regulator [Vulcanimicrobiaceae bacterium]